MFLRPRAAAAIDEIHLYLLERSTPAAARFLDELEATFDRLAEFPDSGRDVKTDRVAGLQLTPLRGFASYLVLFRHDRGRVEVLDVFHGSEDGDTAALSCPQR